MKHATSLRTDSHSDPAGRLRLVASPAGPGRRLVRRDQRHLPRPNASASWPLGTDHPVLIAAAEQIERLLSRPAAAHFDLPLDLAAGTAVPASGVAGPAATSRRARHAQLRRPGAAHRPTGGGARGGRRRRAAIPLSIVVPCHRVLGAGGALTGYAGGLDRKTALLQLEGALIPEAHQSPHRINPHGDVRCPPDPCPAHRIPAAGRPLGLLVPVHAPGRGRVRRPAHGRPAGGAGRACFCCRCFWSRASGPTSANAPETHPVRRPAQLGHPVRAVRLRGDAHHHRPDLHPQRHGAADRRAGGLALAQGPAGRLAHARAGASASSA